MRKIVASFGLILFLLVSMNIDVSAQSNNFNPTACEFQPPAVDRTATLINITAVASKPDPELDGWTNYSWDESIRGLHRNSLAGWPGVDFLNPMTVPFKNGGIVDKVWFDDPSTGGSTGGNSITIKGFDECEGWFVYMGHLDYDATTRYKSGQFIGPDEVVGVPGCSGFEDRCAPDAGPDEPLEDPTMYWKHIHFALGYDENVFDFGDGTDIAYQKGYYWIHVSRMEDHALNMAIMTPPAVIGPGQSLEFDPYTGWYLVDEKTQGFSIALSRSWLEGHRQETVLGAVVIAILLVAAVMSTVIRKILIALLVVAALVFLVLLILS